MAVNKQWLEYTVEYILLFAASGSLILPSIMCQTCHYKPQKHEPLIEITPSPSLNVSRIGRPLNLTCTARENKDYSLKYDSKPAYIDWFYPDGTRDKNRCRVGSAGVAVMTCTLVLDSLSFEKLGNYTCKASTSFSFCSIKRIDIDLHDVRPPELKVPVNSSAASGPNVTLNCTDYGKHQCANNSSAEDETLQGGLPVNVVSSPPGVLEPPNYDRRRPELNIIAIIIPSVIAALVFSAIGGFLLCRRRVRHTRNTELPTTASPSADVEVIPLREEVSSEASTMLLQEKSDIANNSIDAEAPSIPVQEPGSLPFQSIDTNSEGNPLLTEIRVDIPGRKPSHERQLRPIPGVEDCLRPKRPPKSRKKYSTERQITCSCMEKSRDQTSMLGKSYTLNSKDSGYDSAESRESICEMTMESKHTWEIDLEKLKVLDEVLGEGEFGIVKKGLYYGEEVAVKQSKDALCKSNKDDLLSEIQILKQAGRHPNIVSLIGACTQEDNILLVTELIAGGTLESVLKSQHPLLGQNRYENVKCELNDRELLTVTLQIALGMQHLEEKKCIHRDLAARNVFIGADKIAKVGDFGLARDISDEGIYTKTSNDRVPWRWSSLESLRVRVYTSKSDVWSFGILLWEIATYGEVPYPGITTPADLISWLSSGNRMSCPEHCFEELYTLMSSCWTENPLERPTFAYIAKQLEYFLREYKRTYANISDDDISCSIKV